MIKKLKIKFITLATVSSFVLMLILVLCMNILNFNSVINESDKIADFISKDVMAFRDENIPPKDLEDKPFRELPKGMSPEVPYESRFFTVEVLENGQYESNISRVVSVDESTAVLYAKKALKSSSKRGFINNFRYLKKYENGKTRIVFLDCGRKTDAAFNFLKISLIIAGIGLIVVFAVFLLVSNRIVKPIAESYEKQKRFITDAGHEIKTPLTVIRANVDLLESDYGENECINDIKNQTEHLSELTGNLVYLSRMEETGFKTVKIDFPISDLIQETAQSFKNAFSSEKKEYIMDIEPCLEYNGSPEAIRQLVSLLLENAVKYSNSGGTVKIKFQQKKRLVLTVYNTTSETVNNQDLNRVFERFYRADASRNSETGGNGIGLSVAKAIAEQHGGKIKAETINQKDFLITVIF